MKYFLIAYGVTGAGVVDSWPAVVNNIFGGLIVLGMLVAFLYFLTKD